MPGFNLAKEKSANTQPDSWAHPENRGLAAASQVDQFNKFSTKRQIGPNHDAADITFWFGTFRSLAVRAIQSWLLPKFGPIGMAHEKRGSGRCPGLYCCAFERNS